MKEAKVKNVFDGELFYDNNLRKFFRRTKREKCFCDNGDHVTAEPADKSSDGMCFLPDYQVVV